MGTRFELGRRIVLRESGRETITGGCGVACLGWNIPFGMGGDADA